MTGWAALLADGRAARAELLAEVAEVRDLAGDRELRVRLAGGLAFDLRLDHGLDVGPAWWGSTPLAWRSPNPVDPGPGASWEARFLGGLLATCGPDNIGEPRKGVGQHGSHHHTPAHDVAWRREVVDGEVQVVVTGRVTLSSLGGARVEVARTVTARTGEAALTVSDDVTNVGERAVGVPLLYHVNLGAPLLRPGSRLDVDAVRSTTREPLPFGRLPLLTPDVARAAVPVVAEHRDLATDDAATARATLLPPVGDGDGEGGGARVVVSWSADTLPRLCTWSWPSAGAWVLGVEPANAPLFGRERTLPHAGAPVLEAGATWRTWVRIAVETPAGTGPGTDPGTDV
ncbi:hypothetical protein C8046_04920 [Serinibacter arcticus]|uniref:Galactose mutarotase n=1 Tax=Serinibacter arcticus TaxID=1655435 RepID=A0A2U1ZSZ5_9MICO|nr:DUF4432 family protein [Serinibacter arcticus]PWD50109.1 hypothetical protein C8046_04920 [Serinibacter arcticus]